MILIITPNPALDKTAEMADLRPGAIYRIGNLRVQAGGKGLNVARSLRRLGQATLIVAPLAGHAGEHLAELAAADDLALDGISVSGETRTCLVLVHPLIGAATELYEVGDRFQAGEWSRVVERVAARLPATHQMAVCGSFPFGVPETALQHLLELTNGRNISTVVDTHGPPLAPALPVRPGLVKINRLEAAELTGLAIEEPADAVAAARTIQHRGARSVVITLGDRGAIGLDTAGQGFGWMAPVVKGRYPVGSGDAFLAGIIAAIEQGRILRDAVRLGVAVGTANSLQVGAGNFDPADVDVLFPQVTEMDLNMG